MRIALALSAVAALILAAAPAQAQSKRQNGLVIDVKPRSWLDAGTSVPIGYGQSAVRDTWIFGGGPINGISTRGESSLPDRGYGRPLFTFDFLGANVNR